MNSAMMFPGRRVRFHLVALRGVHHRLTRRVQDFLASKRAASAEQARFARVRDEIARMPADMAMDLGICVGDAEELASKVVPRH